MSRHTDWGGPAALTGLIGGIAGGLRLAEHPYPRPGASAPEIRRFFAGDRRARCAARVLVAGQAVSSAGLAALTFSVTDLAARSGRDAHADDTKLAAAVGGTVATASLATSAALTAALTSRAHRPDAGMARLHRLAFLTGGLSHGVGFGLLVGALGAAGLRTGELPRPLARAGLAAAIPNLLAPLYLIDARAAYAIPAGRFPGLLVSAIAGVRLARRAS